MNIITRSYAFLLAALLVLSGCAGSGRTATDTAPETQPSPAPQAAETDTIRRSPYDPAALSYPDLRSLDTPEPTRLELDNGLTVFLLEDHELPQISAVARINAGEVYAPADKVGLASITGSVMRTGGTASMTSDEINQTLENLGATVETSIGETSGSAYMNTLAEHADQVLSIFADILAHPVFAEDKIEQAKTQAKSSISRRNDEPQQIAFREFSQLVYGEDSPYARVPQYYTINAISRDDLIRFHDRYVQPEGTLLSIYGDFDAEAMARQVRETFGQWKADAAYERPTPPEPTAERERTVNFIPKEDVTQSTILIGHLGEITMDNPDYFPVIVMNEVLSGGFTSRLFQRVRTDLGLAYAVFGNYGAGYERPGLFRAGTFTKSGSTIEAARVMLEEIERLKEAPPTDEEVALAKDAYLNSFVFNFDAKREVLSRLMTYEYYGYPADFLNQTRRGVQDVTPEDVHRVAEKYLYPDQSDILVLGNESAFDEPVAALAEGSEVHEVDISIPTSPPSEQTEAQAPASEEDVTRGRELLMEVRGALGGSAFDDVRNMRQSYTTTAQTPAGEQTLTSRLTVKLPGQIRSETTLPNGMTVTVVDDGEQMTLQTPQGTQPAPPQIRRQIMGELRRDLTYLMATADELQVTDAGPRDLEGQTYRALEITPPGGASPFTLLVHPDTNRPARLLFQGTNPQTGEPIETTTVFSDYREVDGLTLPFETVTYRNGEEATTTTLDDFTVNTDLQEGLFTVQQ